MGMVDATPFPGVLSRRAARKRTASWCYLGAGHTTPAEPPQCLGLGAIPDPSSGVHHPPYQGNVQPLSETVRNRRDLGAALFDPARGRFQVRPGSRDTTDPSPSLPSSPATVTTFPLVPADERQSALSAFMT